MRLEMRIMINHVPCLRGKTPDLAPLAKSFRKHQKGNVTYITGQCDYKYNQGLSGNCCNLASLHDGSHNVANNCKIF